MSSPDEAIDSGEAQGRRLRPRLVVSYKDPSSNRANVVSNKATRSAGRSRPTSRSKSKRPPNSTTNQCYCHQDVLDRYLLVLDGDSAAYETLQELAAYEDKLCTDHLQKAFKHARSTSRTSEVNDTTLPSKRQPEPPDIDKLPLPKRQKANPVPLPNAVMAAEYAVLRPVQHDTASDQEYLSLLRSELDEKLQRMDPDSHGGHTNDLLFAIYPNCKHPITDEKDGLVEAHFLSGHEAKALVESATPQLAAYSYGRAAGIPMESQRPSNFSAI